MKWCVVALLGVSSAFGQKGVTTFGLQFKPIIPNRLVGTYAQAFDQPPFRSTVTQTRGYSSGMKVRVGLTEVISLETGIHFTRRNFQLDYALADSGYAAQGDVSVISYGIPLSGLVYIRLAEQLYMNVSLGTGLSFFPSDVKTGIPIGVGKYFRQKGAYRSKAQGNLLANFGVEYRTRSKGTWYIGSSYHLPFSPIMTFAMSYEYEGGSLVMRDNIRGSYLTLDLRYFFHERKE